MNKEIIKCLSLATIALTTCSLVGCGSIIKDVVAVDENVIMKLDDAEMITSYYELVSEVELTSAQKSCTYTSSNPDVVKITSKAMRAVGLGTSEITVTSNLDSSKSCTFTIDVKDTYFDRENSLYDANDNLLYECPEDGHYIETAGQITGYYYIKDVAGSSWYMETEAKIIEAGMDEFFPKFGIVTNTFDNAAAGLNNKVIFFLNAEIGDFGNATWDKFGVCEVANDGNFAWNEGVTDFTARHRDDMYIAPLPFTYNQKIKLGLARDGYNFHTWVNGQYSGSFVALEDLFKGHDGNPCDSTLGLFEFNSNVRFENYTYTLDATQVKAKIDSISNPSYIDSWSVGRDGQ